MPAPKSRRGGVAPDPVAAAAARHDVDAAATVSPITISAIDSLLALAKSGVSVAGQQPLQQPAVTHPDFASVNALVALQPAWMQQSTLKMLSLAFMNDALIRFDPAKQRGGDIFNYAGSVSLLICKAFRVPVARAMTQRDEMTGFVVADGLRGLFDFNPSQRVQLTVAMCVLADLAHADELVALLSLVSDRATRCESAKQHAINMIIVAAGSTIRTRIKEKAAAATDVNLTAATSTATSTTTTTPASAAAAAASATAATASAEPTFDECLAQLFDIVTDFLDDYKLRAFTSSIVEPARYYFACIGDTSGRDHVNVHGLNWYLFMVEEALQLGMPVSSVPDDVHLMGIGDFWSGLGRTPEESLPVWRKFMEPRFFGAHFEGMKLALSTNLRRPPAAIAAPLSSFRNQFRTDPSARRLWLLTIQRFAEFFSHAVLVPRMLQTLNSEIKSEHCGFRRVCAQLFAAFRARGLDVLLAPREGEGGDAGGSYGDFDEWCYDDEYFMNMNVDRVAAFFAWLGVIKPPAGGRPIVADAPGNVKWPVASGDGDAAAAKGAKHRPLASMPLYSDAVKTGAATAAAPTTGTGTAAADDAGAAAAGADDDDDGGGGMMERAASSGGALAGMLGRESSTSSAGGMALVDRQSSSDVFDRSVCPICLLAKPDVTVLPHGPSHLGDYSSHRTCADCRDMIIASAAQGDGVTVCPFCREQLASDEFITAAQTFAASVPDLDRADPDASAALFESWQMLEMSHPNQRPLLERIAGIVLRDPRCGGVIARGAQRRATWLADMAGVVFRLHAIVTDSASGCGGGGSGGGAAGGARATTSQVAPFPAATVAMLRDAVECILGPVEKKEPSALGNMDPHHAGALYTQALAALLAADGSGMPTRTLAQLVRRTAVAIVDIYGGSRRPKDPALCARVRERVHASYVRAAKRLVWGDDVDLFAAAFAVREQ